ncbi:MAG: 4-(cytidine 5'-diphospho)-2-C-methyl-D-erythritol kinase [bacterium]
MNWLRLPSYAKINFGLIIKSKRRDGFHEIETILQQIDLKDEIELQAKEEPNIELCCEDPDIPTGNANLCVQAANLLTQTLGLQKGVNIVLKKSIPAGAGLGGGSSNAAVVLLGLNKLWNLKLKPEKLKALASQLGSDVPFFIHGGTAIARGRGDILLPCHIQGDFTILIIIPRIRISTHWAYGRVNLSLTMNEKNIKLKHFRSTTCLDAEFFNDLTNDLETTVFERHPILSRIKTELYHTGAIFASMSGSGSAIFGIFQKRNQALKAKQHFRNQYAAIVSRPISWGFEQIN